ncbi:MULTISPECIES: hypothetical protein [Pseudoxanthomonas]|uniref:Sel1 repeat family protein n=1 Tax=Pseudoxanthomonas winnipegensis TaxID=2480810 RepID=A0AAW8G792_9GAMM|nr:MULTISPECIES: hypothetical protein [Pseudoxanthomonas]MDQ1118274.1 hypothetical protein [Pseudoxanthomonas winnipegensis]MDQ1131455.1 hypothetical protein [Pseudoxanthomonas winnipegensis]MDR6138526.1 hypothetical protein [Pseudoxanthomonas sp. SORGH_AS_0997]
MSPRGRFNLVMGVLVLAAVGFGVWRWRRQADEAAALSARIAAQTAQAQRAFAARNDPAGATPTRTDALAASALPPWGEPLGANLQAVLRRADAGEAAAACRIAVELMLCAAPSPADAGRDRCQGVDAALRGKAAFYLRKAALAGNRDALLRYAAGPFPQAAKAQDHERYLQDPGFADWYGEAVPMLQRALQAGDPRAALLLANAYSDDQGLLDARVPDDPALAYRYRLLLSYLKAGPAPDVSTLALRQRVDAERQAQRLFREAFGSRALAAPVSVDLELRPDDPAAAPCQ